MEPTLMAGQAPAPQGQGPAVPSRARPGPPESPAPVADSESNFPVAPVVYLKQQSGGGNAVERRPTAPRLDEEGSAPSSSGRDWAMEPRSRRSFASCRDPYVRSLDG